MMKRSLMERLEAGPVLCAEGYLFELELGYVSCGEANQQREFEKIHASQNSVDFPSDLYVGDEAHRFLKGIWPDFQTHSTGFVLHEKMSGYAGTLQAVRGYAQMCERHGVRILSGVEVTGYELVNGTVKAVHTDQGNIRCDLAILGLGAWIPEHWKMLGLPMKMDVHYADGTHLADKDTWTYWMLEEGEVYYDGPYYDSNNKNPPIVHIELMNTPVVCPQTGRTLKDNVYVYWKNGTERMERPGIQGGTMPICLGPKAETEPYGHANDHYQATKGFADYFTACLEMFMPRFQGCRQDFKERRNGGIGAFTPDNVPIIDFIKDNVVLVADSNHGFKASGIGKLLARQLVTGKKVEELQPFRLSRFAEGKAFGSGVTNCPWV